MGHVIQLRREGIKASAPMFIPFLGAAIFSKSLGDNALAEARVFERDYEPGQSFAALGIATLGAAIGASRIPDINNAIPAGLTTASVLLIAYGGSKLESAYRALSKAVWWYNRDLRK